MSLVYSIRWEIFQQMMVAHTGYIKVHELEDRYNLYLDTESETFRCSVFKDTDAPERAFQFIDSYLNKPSVIKVMAVVPSEKVNETEPEPEHHIEDEEISKMTTASSLVDVENVEIELPDGVAMEGD